MTASYDDVWRWLEASWTDLRRRPSTSLGYGLFVTALSYAVVACLHLDAVYLFLPLAAGFMFGGPLLVGLYEISRRGGERPGPAAKPTSPQNDDATTPERTIASL